MSQEQIKEIEISVQEAKKAVELGRAVDRLSSNRDFRKIVDEGYFEAEAARLARAFSDINLPDHIRQSAQNEMLGLGAFMRYLRTISQQAHIAQTAMAQAEEALDELRAEEGGEV